MREPKAWKATTLGAIANDINGFAFTPTDWSERGVPIIRIAQLNDPTLECDHYEHELPLDYRIDTGDLIFSWSATLSTMIWDRGPAYLNQHLFKVVPEPGTERTFLHHLLNFKMEELAGHSHGTTMRHIRRSDLLPFPVNIPPVSEQRLIAEILDTVDEAIRKTEAIIAKLGQVKQGLLHDLLTRGIDEHGQLRDPDRHPEQFKDSPLGRIPKEWEVHPLLRLVSLPSGQLDPRKLPYGHWPLVAPIISRAAPGGC